MVTDHDGESRNQEKIALEKTDTKSTMCLLASQASPEYNRLSLHSKTLNLSHLTPSYWDETDLHKTCVAKIK